MRTEYRSMVQESLRQDRHRLTGMTNDKTGDETGQSGSCCCRSILDRPGRELMFVHG